MKLNKNMCLSFGIWRWVAEALQVRLKLVLFIPCPLLSRFSSTVEQGDADTTVFCPVVQVLDRVWVSEEVPAMQLSPFVLGNISPSRLLRVLKHLGHLLLVFPFQVNCLALEHPTVSIGNSSEFKANLGANLRKPKITAQRRRHHNFKDLHIAFFLLFNIEVGVHWVRHAFIRRTVFYKSGHV